MEEDVETGKNEKKEKTDKTEVELAKEEAVIVEQAVIPTQTEPKKMKKLKIKEIEIKQEFPTVSSSKSSKNKDNCKCHFCTRISTEN